MTISLTQSIKALADPTRMRLMLLVLKEELTVAELQSILEMGQSRISSHLGLLKQAGLVTSRRVGKNSFYGAALSEANEDGALVESLLRKSEAELPEAKKDSVALKVVLQKRQDAAREYFNRLAGRFGRSHCPGRSWQALSHLLLDLLPPMVIADLGAGEGTLSQLLAGTAEQVIAVDNSERMVEFGSHVAQENGFANLEYRLGDIQDPPIEPESVDVAIYSQALHHAVNPPKALAAAYRILKPGGRVLVLDLLSHSFEQARDLYADLWLGFGEPELHDMLEKNGFRKVRVEVVSREEESPHFATIFGRGTK